jgi:hypothetical protein
VRAPFYRREEVETRAARLHRELEALLGERPEMPIDVDLIGEQILGLSWLYEPIPEPPGTTILAALHLEHRLVVLNERHVETFGRNEGLERFTKAHELGHWVLHAAVGARAPGPVESTPGGARLPALACVPGACGYRQRGTPAAPEAERRWQEIQANWFAAALLMPPMLLRSAAAEVDVTCWRGRYDLCGRCGVSISALNSRLKQLGYPSVRE